MLKIWHLFLSRSCSDAIVTRRHRMEPRPVVDPFPSMRSRDRPSGTKSAGQAASISAMFGWVSEPQLPLEAKKKRKKGMHEWDSAARSPTSCFS